MTDIPDESTAREAILVALPHPAPSLVSLEQRLADLIAPSITKPALTAAPKAPHPPANHTIDYAKPTAPSTAPWVKRIYIGGPMKGIPESNYPLFLRVAEYLRSRGAIVYNPAEYVPASVEAGFPIRAAFAEYAEFICRQADVLVLLPGWRASTGVRAEKALAENCDLEIIDLELSTQTAVPASVLAPAEAER